MWLARAIAFYIAGWLACSCPCPEGSSCIPPFRMRHHSRGVSLPEGNVSKVRAKTCPCMSCLGGEMGVRSSISHIGHSALFRHCLTQDATFLVCMQHNYTLRSAKSTIVYNTYGQQRHKRLATACGVGLEVRMVSEPVCYWSVVPIVCNEVQAQYTALGRLCYNSMHTVPCSMASIQQI